MRLRFLGRLILICMFLPAVLMGLGVKQIHAQVEEITLESPVVLRPRTGTRILEYYNTFGPGCGMCGGLNGAPFFSLQLGTDLWAGRFWQVGGTYVDHQPSGNFYEQTTMWSFDVGRRVGDVTVYTGWASLQHYWTSGARTDLEGPTVGARWNAGSLSFDLALRHDSPSILGTSAKMSLSIPLSEGVSTTIGLEQWVYFLDRTRFYVWTHPYIGVKMEW